MPSGRDSFRRNRVAPISPILTSWPVRVDSSARRCSAPPPKSSSTDLTVASDCVRVLLSPDNRPPLPVSFAPPPSRAFCNHQPSTIQTPQYATPIQHLASGS